MIIRTILLKTALQRTIQIILEIRFEHRMVGAEWSELPRHPTWHSFLNASVAEAFISSL